MTCNPVCFVFNARETPMILLSPRDLDMLSPFSVHAYSRLCLKSLPVIQVARIRRDLARKKDVIIPKYPGQYLN